MKKYCLFIVVIMVSGFGNSSYGRESKYDKDMTAITEKACLEIEELGRKFLSDIKKELRNPDETDFDEPSLDFSENYFRADIKYADVNSCPNTAEIKRISNEGLLVVEEFRTVLSKQAKTEKETPAPKSSNIIDDLKALKELLDSGAITQEEFEMLKDEVLSR